MLDPFEFNASVSSHGFVIELLTLALDIAESNMLLTSRPFTYADFVLISYNFFEFDFALLRDSVDFIH